jgi:aryl-alcohol dehydrogenase-like predicted oxidoreductase
LIDKSYIGDNIFDNHNKVGGENMTDDFPKNHPVLENIKLGTGTWAWGDKLYWGYGRDYNQEDLKAAFQTSLEAGITFFDTAEVYGQGVSETLLGKFAREANPSIKIASKFMPYPWRLRRGSLIRALRGSLKRLGKTTLDLYQIHQPLPPITIETWMDAMAEAYQAGMIRAIGVSNYNRDQMQQAFDCLTRQGLQLASNQVEFSLLERRPEKTGLLKQCHELGVTLIAYSPLASGVLTGKYTPENPIQGFRGMRYSRKFLTQIAPLIIELRKIGAGHAGKTPAQVALNWVMCKGALPIPGAKTGSQAEQNSGALGWELTDEEVARLDEISDRALLAA